MRVFVYEYLTACGIGRDADSPGHGMYAEGRAMRDALAEDFRQLPGVEAFTYPDADAPVELNAVYHTANESDWTVLIAPESGNVLADLAEEVWPSSSRLLGPSLSAIRLTTDKLALADHWLDRDVPCPATTDREPSRCEAFPVVWKPRDGAGSTATYRINSALDVARVKARHEAANHGGPMILQEFVPGRAVSVAFLCGPAGVVPLPPAFQRLSDDDRLKYLGGELPVPAELAERAVRLGRAAVTSVAGLRGYVGVDLVLGDAADGSRDFAIEINPRLTTSYVGLRALAEFNLAGAMLAVASGTPPEPFRWKPGPVRFTSDGAVTPV